MSPLDRRSALALTGLLLAACSAPDPADLHFAGRVGSPAPSDTTPAAPDPTRTTAPPSPPIPAEDAGGGGVDAGARPADAGASDASDAASDAPPGLAIQSFTLLDTVVNSGQGGTAEMGYDPIKNGDVISLNTVGLHLSVRANVGQTPVGSIGFDYNGTKHTENAFPYCLCGDDGNGNITDCNLTAGQYTITATPYTEANLGGTAGTPLTITFTLQ